MVTKKVQPSPIEIPPDGREGTPGEATEANSTIWYPPLPAAFKKARDATVFSRVDTRYPSARELEAALESTPDIDQTFCLSVNTVILIFSPSRDAHYEHVGKVWQMLSDRRMLAGCDDVGDDYVFHCATSADAGIRLDRVGERRIYKVTDEGFPGRRRAAKSCLETAPGKTSTTSADGTALKYAVSRRRRSRSVVGACLPLDALHG